MWIGWAYFSTWKDLCVVILAAVVELAVLGLLVWILLR